MNFVIDDYTVLATRGNGTIVFNVVGSKVCSRTKPDVILRELSAAFRELFGYDIWRRERELHADWSDAERIEWFGKVCLFRGWPQKWESQKTSAEALGMAPTVWDLLRKYRWPDPMKFRGSAAEVKRWKERLADERGNMLTIATAGHYGSPDPEGLKDLYFLLTGQDIE